MPSRRHIAVDGYSAPRLFDQSPCSVSFATEHRERNRGTVSETVTGRRPGPPARCAEDLDPPHKRHSQQWCLRCRVLLPVSPTQGHRVLAAFDEVTPQPVPRPHPFCAPVFSAGMDSERPVQTSRYRFHRARAKPGRGIVFAESLVFSRSQNLTSCPIEPWLSSSTRLRSTPTVPGRRCQAHPANLEIRSVVYQARRMPISISCR